MRLSRLWIGNFKNLHDFEIKFEDPFSFLLGWNGTGKSNLIEAIVIIFRDLDAKNNNIITNFNYEIEYICGGVNIRIEHSSDANTTKWQTNFYVDGKKISKKDFLDNREEWQPAHVFAYYSGPSNRLETHFFKPQNQFYNNSIHNKLLPGDIDKLGKFFYAQPVHSNFVLLSFFCQGKSKVLKSIRKLIDIERFISALFILRKPTDWKKTNPNFFWGAGGLAGEIAQRLYLSALAPIKISNTFYRGFRRHREKSEVCFLYLPNQKALRKISKCRQSYDTDNKYGNWSPRQLFKAFETLYISDLLEEVRIKVKVSKLNEPITFRELSEGEQQFLTVLGLMEFTKTKESLFLLDEPDTHLNPRWSMDYVEYLNTVLTRTGNAHVIMATHDPLVICGLDRQQLHIFKRDGTSGKVYAEPPDFSPKGMGVGGILTSDIFDLKSQLDNDTNKKLQKLADLSSKPNLSEGDKHEIKKLRTQLLELGFNDVYRDPKSVLVADLVRLIQKRKKSLPAGNAYMNLTVEIERLIARFLK